MGEKHIVNKKNKGNIQNVQADTISDSHVVQYQNNAEETMGTKRNKKTAPEFLKKLFGIFPIIIEAIKRLFS